jgi:hypothetical protein
MINLMQIQMEKLAMRNDSNGCLNQKLLTCKSTLGLSLPLCCWGNMHQQSSLPSHSLFEQERHSKHEVYSQDAPSQAHKE